jgi:ribose 5-phosphate isomerase B
MGTHTPDSVDYPDFGAIVGRAVAAGEFDLGILVCGTGVGITISANKIKGVRAACVSEPYSARMSRAHNNANIIGFGSRVVGLGLALEIVEAFLQTPFQAGTRHETRVDKINALDCAREEV